MELTWRAKTVGPTLPSFYLNDDRLPSNKSYGFNLFGSDAPCMDWLEKQSISSVVLVSYGTFSNYDAAQLEELGNGICNSGKSFIWVVRSNEAHKLSEELRKKCEKNGLIVSWCPQLEVLAHKAIESAWGMGVRVRKSESGSLRSAEVERCIREVMDGERKDDYKRNAMKWMQKAKEAMQEGGSSDKHIVEFAAKYSSI
uniref:Putative UDP-glucosyltransferase n=1 Tax=Aegilops tauschii TaxID=37682 RepID=M8BV10_AEGTA